MFAATFVLMCVVAHVAAKIPSYIHVCGRRDPNLEQCILKNIDNLKTKICEGMPELDVQPTEPFYIKKINIINTNNAKISISDVYITGLCDYDINSFRLDLDKMHFDVDITFRRIYINTTYDFNVNILVVPVAIKGPIRITTDNVSAKAGIDLKNVTKGGKEYIYLPQIDMQLDVKGYDADVSSFNDAEMAQLREISQNLLGNSQEEIIKVVTPTLEKIISEQILSFSNNIVKHFTFDELFPDRE